jgi:HK97 family phage major capsid protein|nr:MAG TPA: major capsid protein [Caudoviricetes sp.]
MTLEEVKEELKKIVEKLESSDDMTDEEISELEEKAAKLEAEKRSLITKAEKRKETLEKIKRNSTGYDVETAEEGKEERNMNEENIRSSKEYRSAFLKRLQRKDLTEAEERALTTASSSVGAAIPTITQNLIIEKVFQVAPLLNEITLLRVDGNVTFAVESTVNDATLHTEGATITESGDVLIPVSLGQYEVNKYITISKSVSKMSIDAFETWITNMLGKMIAKAITNLIINGTGSSQPKGIDKAATWGDTNSVTVGKTASLSEANVLTLVGLLNGGYDANAKWLMSKKTLINDFRPLQDKSKNDIFVKENGIYYIEGYPVLLDERVAEHDAFLGDLTMYVGNLGEEVTVDQDKKLSSNSFEFLGSAMFDGKPAVSDAFVKLTKATS